MADFLQQTVNGLSLGCVYALLALGYTMVYGILQLINFAHGEVYMVGAYAGIIAAGWFAALDCSGVPLLAGVFAFAMAYAAGVGLAVERIAYRPLRDAPRLCLLISAMGVSFFLQNAVMLTQGKGDKVFPQQAYPAFLDRIYPIGGAAIGAKQVLLVSASLLLMALLRGLVLYTRTGRAMRAVAQDRTAAALVGVRIDRVVSMTFAIGSALAGAAGVLVSLEYRQAGTTLGFTAGLKAFTAAVLGGIGSIPGALLGGGLLGLTETYTARYGPSEYKDAVAFVLLIAVLLARPTGILGRSQEERA